jgi:hypothetical protein
MNVAEGKLVESKIDRIGRENIAIDYHTMAAARIRFFERSARIRVTAANQRTPLSAAPSFACGIDRP